MRNPIKALVAAASGLVIIAMMATPASAATYTFELTSGTIDVYEFLGSTPLFSVDLAGDTEECPGGINTSFLEVLPDPPPPVNNGTLEGYIISTSEVAIGSPTPNYLSELSLTFGDASLGQTGTWTRGTPSSTAVIDAEATVTLTPLEGECDGDEEAGTCVITATDLELTGVFKAGANPQALVFGDYIDVVGGNDDGELSVIDNGDPPVCGAAGGADFGRVEIDARLSIT